MEGFKIIRNPNQPIPTTKHIRAKCCKTHGEFVIRLEHDKKGWCMVYSTKPDDDSSRSSISTVNGELKFEDGLYVGNDYACPCCGNKSIVRCGSCGRITCNDGGKYFKCAYCDNSGEISGKITSVYVEPPASHAKK